MIFPGFFKVLRKVLFIALCMVVFAPGLLVASTRTFIFKPADSGKWPDKCFKLAIQEETEGNIHKFMIKCSGEKLSEFIEKTSISTVNYSTPQKLMAVTSGDKGREKKLDVGVHGDEVVFTEFYDNRRRRSLMVYPILPVYDFSSLLFSLGRNHLEPFDFYLAIKGKRIRMAAYVDSNSGWKIKYRGRELIKIFPNEKHLPGTIILSNPDWFGGSDVVLQLECIRAGGLQRIPEVKVSRIIAYVKKKLIESDGLSAWMSGVDLDQSGRITWNNSGRKWDWRDIAISGNLEPLIRDVFARRLPGKITEKTEINKKYVKESGVTIFTAETDTSSTVEYKVEELEDYLCKKFGGNLRLDGENPLTVEHGVISIPVTEIKKECLGKKDFPLGSIRTILKAKIPEFDYLTIIVNGEEYGPYHNNIPPEEISLTDEEGEILGFQIYLKKKKFLGNNITPYPFNREYLVATVKNMFHGTRLNDFNRIFLDLNTIYGRGYKGNPYILLHAFYEKQIKNNKDVQLNVDELFRNKNGSVSEGLNFSGRWDEKENKLILFEQSPKLQKWELAKEIIASVAAGLGLDFNKQSPQTGSSNDFIYNSEVIQSLEVEDDLNFVMKLGFSLPEESLPSDLQLAGRSVDWDADTGKLVAMDIEDDFTCP